MVGIAEYFDPHFTPFWTILRQVGIDAAISKLDRRFDGEWNNSGDRPWDYAPLHAMKRRYEEAGLELFGIEDYPPMDRIRLGLPGRDEEIEAVCTLIRNMGRLEIPMLCYNWMGCINWVRTDIARPGRAGAKVTAFRHADMGEPGLTWAGEVRRGTAVACVGALHGHRRSRRREGRRPAGPPSGRPADRRSPRDRQDHEQHRVVRPRDGLRRERGERDLPLSGELRALLRRPPRRRSGTSAGRAISPSATFETCRGRRSTSSRPSTTRG